MAALVEAPSIRSPIVLFQIARHMAFSLFSFWSGAPLGYLERLCMASMLRAGHQLVVYSYDSGLAVPAGVVLRDAAEILPQSRTILHESGSWAPFADIFRYEALLKGIGTWVDLDVLLLKPLDDLGDYVFGWQDANVINNAVLKLPRDSECLGRLVALGRADVVVPPQWPRRQALKQRMRGLVGAQTPMENLEWGAVGPFALTRLIADFRLMHRCQPVDVFYPVPWQQAHLTFEPDTPLLLNVLSSSTRAIHLWNDRIKELKRTPPPRGSLIAQMCERYGIDPT